MTVSGAKHLTVCVSDQLSRLHMILKPFMLRRIKKDVENELSDKVEESIFLSVFAELCLYSGQAYSSI